METLEMLNDPIDRRRLDEADRSIAAGRLTGRLTGRDEMDRLVAERVQRARDAP